MIIIDYSQTVISSIMAEMNIKKDNKLEVNLIRHMVLNAIRSYVKEFRKDYGQEVIIACDSRKYWRKNIFPNYKANRKKYRQESGHDWNIIFDTINLLKKEIEENLPYYLIEIEGAEADDIIATYIQCMKEPNEKVLIISADHDFMQLHNSSVDQWSSTKNNFVKCIKDPKQKLFEHIIKGDKGDGIPNVFSDDDSIIDGRRQRPVHSKKLELWKKDPTCMPQDSSFIKNYERNQTLIDLTRIPDDIKNAIKEKIKFLVTSNKYPSKETLKNYFNEHKLNNMLELIEEF